MTEPIALPNIPSAASNGTIKIPVGRVASTTLIALVVSSLAVAGYHFATAPLRPALAIVDLAAVYQAKETAFSKAVAKNGITDAEKAAAIADAQEFAKQLTKSLGELPEECSCLVLLANAVASRPANVEDLTPLLRKKVGL